MVERWLVGAACGLVVATGLATGTAAEPAAARQDVLLQLLKQDCGSCHGLTMKGGLGPALLPESLAETPDDVLVATILHGRPGTPMPPWDFEISEEEAQWLVSRLRAGNLDE